MRFWILFCFFLFVCVESYSQSPDYLTKIPKEYILAEIEISQSSILIDDIATNTIDFEGDFANKYKERIKEIPPQNIMLATVVFKVSDQVKMTRVDSIRNVLSKNFVLKVLYQTDNLLGKGYLLKLYTYEDYGKKVERPIVNIRENYFSELNKPYTTPDTMAKIEIENIPPPPPPPPSTPTTYSFLKSYIVEGKLDLPFEQGINSITFHGEKVYLNNEYIDEMKLMNNKMQELLMDEGEKIFVLVADDFLNFRQYKFFLKLMFSNIYELREKLSQKNYSKPYHDCSYLEKRQLKKMVPLKIIDFSYDQWDALLNSN